MAGIGLNPSGCCCTAAGDFTVTCLGCNSTPIPGCGITIKIGTTIYCTGTTDAAGTFTCTLPTAGITYTVVATPPASPPGYQTVTTTTTPGSFPASLTINMGPFVGGTHVCCGACNVPIPNTLYVTLGDGTYTCVKSGSFWTYSGLTIGNVNPVKTTTPSLNCSDTKQINILIHVSCAGSQMGVSVSWGETLAIDDCGVVYDASGGGAGDGNTTYTPSSCLPFAFSGTMAHVAGSTGNPTGSSSVAVSS